MKTNNLFKLLTSIAISEAAGIIGALFTNPAIQSGWYANLVKPELAPPNWIFAPVWITLCALISIALFLVWKNNWQIKNQILDSKHQGWNQWSKNLRTGQWQKFNIITIFIFQLILNIIWSYLFFSLHLPNLAFFEIIALLISIIYLIINFYRVSKVGAWLLLPYLIWVGFAAYLNYSLWILN